jgi:hypothetical protein
MSSTSPRTWSARHYDFAIFQLSGRGSPKQVELRAGIREVDAHNRHLQVGGKAQIGVQDHIQPCGLEQIRISYESAPSRASQGPDSLRITSQVLPAAMSFLQNLSRGARSSSAMAIM